MASVFEGFISSRRRPSRSRSESGKQLHARWGDASISAPNGGGWSQQYLEDDLNTVVYQAQGSPDSQKTLVNNSPDLSFNDHIEKVSIDEIRQPSPPLSLKEKGAITITIPLPWFLKSHRRSSSSGRQQVQVAQVVEQVTATEARPVLQSITNDDEVIVVESRPVAEPFRATSPVVHAQSPVYDDVSTFFTRAAFPTKHATAGRLPQIQTSVPINKSQPASALSILSPVAEKYNGMSESNNATPMDNTPIAQQIASSIPAGADGVIDVSTITDRLENYARRTPPSLPPSRVTSPILDPGSITDRPESRGAARGPSRPPSRGVGIGEVAFMRASSRGPSERGDGRRSASTQPVKQRAGSVEPLRRRALSRSTDRHRADSPRRMSGRSFSREVAASVNMSREREPGGRRGLSREPAVHRAESPERGTLRNLSVEPLRPRAESPGPASRRAHDWEPSGHPELSPVQFGRRAISREPTARRRMSIEATRRAASVDPVRRRASPREDLVPGGGGGNPLLRARRRRSDSSDPSSADELTSDETTDIETETENEELYFESRKGWNGPAVAGVDSKGFYGDVINDYKFIARDVVADQTSTPAAKPPSTSLAVEVVTLLKKETTATESYREPRRYGGPALVPDHEELWG